MKVIYLNGPSSSGKTSLSKKLQQVLAENYLHIGIDTLISMMPDRTNNFLSTEVKEGFSWKETTLVNEEVGMRIVSGDYGKHVNSAFHQVVKSLLDSGNHLIIDDVADGDSEVSIWELELQQHSFIKVGVFCDLTTLNVREKSRADRMCGSAAEQFYRVHESVTYDLKVHTDQYSIDECAQQILQYLNGKIEEQHP